jgi:glutamine amidotransferase
MIGIINYKLGNTGNLINALHTLGYESILTDDKEVLEACDTIILPGVGHFKEAMQNIKSLQLEETIISLSVSKPLIGICLGMQLLFESSEEGRVKGLSILDGHIERIQSKYPIPHLGWNTLESKIDLLDGKDVYFVHSYQLGQSEDIIATTDYGTTIPAIVKKNNITGIQFHPEKSGEVGLKILDHTLKGDY